MGSNKQKYLRTIVKSSLNHVCAYKYLLTSDIYSDLLNFGQVRVVVEVDRRETSVHSGLGSLDIT